MRPRKKYLSPVSSERFLKLLEEESSKRKGKPSPYAFAGLPRNTYYRWKKTRRVPESVALKVSAEKGLELKDFLSSTSPSEALILKRAEALADLVELYGIFYRKGNQNDLHICQVRLLTLLQQRLFEAGFETLLSSSRRQSEHDSSLVVKAPGDDRIMFVRILPTHKGGPFLLAENEDHSPISGCTMCSTNIRRFVRVIKSAFTKEENLHRELDQQAEIFIKNSYEQQRPYTGKIF